MPIYVFPNDILNAVTCNHKINKKGCLALSCKCKFFFSLYIFCVLFLLCYKWYEIDNVSFFKRNLLIMFINIIFDLIYQQINNRLINHLVFTHPSISTKKKNNFITFCWINWCFDFVDKKVHSHLKNTTKCVQEINYISSQTKPVWLFSDK